MDSKAERHRFPWYGWFGIGLVALFWTLNWTLQGLRTHWGFFPMWLGYSLTVDALVFLRRGDSLLTRNRVAYVGLFLVSMPGWWLFELINLHTKNWHYLGTDAFTNFEYFVHSSVSFSTVMPAVFSTAELMGTFNWIRKIRPGPRIAPTPRTLRNFTIAGFVMLNLLLIWPRYCFPFVWLMVFCLIEPLNYRLGHRTLFESTQSGDWRSVWTLWTGCLICGFFWELWNYWSYPKWIYKIPFVDFLHVFEMPLLGYFGYLPFALELYGLYHLVTGLLGLNGDREYLTLLSEKPDPFKNSDQL